MSKNEEKRGKHEMPPKPEKPEPKEEEVIDSTPETPAEEPAADNAELDSLKANLAEANDKYLRMLAEYDNYRRRSQKERESIYADVRSDTVAKFLPVYDNLSRAVQHETDEATRKGVEGIFNQLKTILEGLGVTEIPAVGKKFDPTVHEALMHIDDEKYGEGEIVLELEKGFMMGDKVLRYAKVQVAN